MPLLSVSLFDPLVLTCKEDLFVEGSDAYNVENTELTTEAAWHRVGEKMLSLPDPLCSSMDIDRPNKATSTNSSRSRTRSRIFNKTSGLGNSKSGPVSATDIRQKVTNNLVEKESSQKHTGNVLTPSSEVADTSSRLGSVVSSKCDKSHQNYAGDILTRSSTEAMDESNIQWPGSDVQNKRDDQNQNAEDDHSDEAADRLSVTRLQSESISKGSSMKIPRTGDKERREKEIFHKMKKLGLMMKPHQKETAARFAEFRRLGHPSSDGLLETYRDLHTKNPEMCEELIDIIPVILPSSDLRLFIEKAPEKRKYGRKRKAF